MAALPPTFGPMTKEQFMSSIKTEPQKAVDALKKSNTVFNWLPGQTGYYESRDGQTRIEPPAQPPNILYGARPGSMFQHPVQLKEAVKKISSVDVKQPKFHETLTPGALKAYNERKQKFEQKPYPLKVLDVAGETVSDAFADPAVSIIDAGLNKLGMKTKRRELQEQEEVIEQKINDLMERKEYTNARQLYDSYMQIKISQMSDKDLIKEDTDHPLIYGVTDGLAIGSMQFIALRNAPLLKTMGDTLKAKTAAKFSTLAAGGGTVGKLAASKTARGLAKMAEELMGDLPAEFVMPVLNFDFDRRPLSELPEQVMKDLSLLIPAALGFHAAGKGIGASAKGTILAATSVAAVMKSLRMPLGKGAGKALEQAAMDEADNAFSRILSQMPEEKMTLQQHFMNVRQMADGERRMLALRNSPDNFSTMGESRPAGIGGPKGTPSPDDFTPLPPENQVVPVPRSENVDAWPMGMPDEPGPITAADRSFLTRTGRQIKQELIGKEGAMASKKTRAGIKEALTSPVPEVDIIQTPARSVWFKNFLDVIPGAGDRAGEGASEFMRLMVDELEPVRGFKDTYNRLKAYPKVTSQKVNEAWTGLADIYNRHFATAAEIKTYHRYAYLKQMLSRAELDLKNPKVTALNIPDNAPADWIRNEIATMQNPQLESAHRAIKGWDNQFILNNLLASKRITPEIANEWAKKYPDHVSFMYEKYIRKTGGNPHQSSSYNFSARDYLTAIKGAEGIEARANLFDVRMRSAVRAITDLHTDDIARSMREEIGAAPLKITETPTGRRIYSAIVKGELYEFDINDIENGAIDALKDQRVLYSKVDDQAFLVPKKIHDVIMNVNQGAGPVQRAFARMTGVWRDMTTTYNPIFAVVTNPMRDLQNAMTLTDHSTKEFLGAYISTARDLLAMSILPDPKKLSVPMKELDSGHFAIDDSLIKTVEISLQKSMNWMARKIGTQKFEEFHHMFTVESGASQGGRTPSMPCGGSGTVCG